MFTFSRDELVTLAKQKRGWSVSLYMPLHPQDGERRQDAVRLRNLLKAAERRLSENGLPNSQVYEFLRPAREFLDAVPFSDSIDKGLALFITRSLFRAHQCDLPFRAQVVLGQPLFIKPLLPLLNELGIFYLLTLSENHVALLRGNREALIEIPLADLPHSLKEALHDEQVEKQHQFRTIAPTVGTGTRMALFYGQGQGTENC